MSASKLSEVSVALIDRLCKAPVVVDDARARMMLADLEAQVPALSALLARPHGRELMLGVLAGSTYLSSVMRRDAARLIRVLTTAPEAHLLDLAGQLNLRVAGAATQAQVMTALRLYKTEVALTVALADLGGAFGLGQVTLALAQAADVSLQTGLGFLFREAARRGDWLGGAQVSPEASSGLFVLAMGKHGAFELNYSSDIDLIVLYDARKLKLKAGVEASTFFVRMVRDLVRLLQERTGDGYVFRVDLRLRPDPGATQVALSTDAALQYYETFGQNWERAALIKARPVAGDIETGQAFLRELAPYIWRRYLDFAAIADIHAMKRQIHAHRGFGEIAVAGHNLKLGRGGIREIEFFAQTQQLIAGGRQPDLRVGGTLAALARLEARGWISATVVHELGAAYDYLRGLEHRLQMVADEQTHQLPLDAEELESFAHFAGYPDTPALGAELVGHLQTVQRHYGALFQSAPDLSAAGVNMVFAGEADDQDTLAELARMGFSQGAQILETMRGWHHGRYRAVRSPAARERLTVVQLDLLRALSQSANPDAAFLSFDRFLSDLPTGIQLFALLSANPRLLQLMSVIMGSAPRLASILSRRSRLLDAVIDPGDLASFDEGGKLAAEILADDLPFEAALDKARIAGNEQAFVIGVRLLSGAMKPADAQAAYAALAERLIRALQITVDRDMARRYGGVPGGAWCVVALGKLGGREMTATSDLDLIVIYESPDGLTMSSGLKPLAVSQYYARATQRLITALSTPTAEGRLYDVDMRLRPSGQKGPIATRLESFIEYQAKDAWTWEHMALTRARVVSGPQALRARVTAAIRDVLCRPRDAQKTLADVIDMRNRTAAEKPSADIWEMKQVRGGLLDVEFIAQALQLQHAHAVPHCLSPTTTVALERLAHAGVLPPEEAAQLITAARLYSDLAGIIRLCLEGPFDPEMAPDGLKRLLADVAGEPTFERLQSRLQETIAATWVSYQRLLGPGATENVSVPRLP